ncbi:MAG: hypothetical protein ABR907_06380 [Terracidiphilus sp.]|jgi:hypothetical protein
MTPSALPLLNPVVALAIRAVLGGSVIVIARYFYAHPAESFRNSSRVTAEFPWITRMVRGMACFCLWGGCFILGAAVAVQIFGLHGYLLAAALILLSALGAWMLLPRKSSTSASE